MTLMPRRVDALDWTAFVLVIIGALNWGLVGFFDFNLVDAIFGVGSLISRIIYAVVGLAGLYAIYSLYKIGTMREAPRAAEEMRRRAA